MRSATALVALVAISLMQQLRPARALPAAIDQRPSPNADWLVPRGMKLCGWPSCQKPPVGRNDVRTWKDKSGKFYQPGGYLGPSGLHPNELPKVGHKLVKARDGVSLAVDPDGRSYRLKEVREGGKWDKWMGKKNQLDFWSKAHHVHLEDETLRTR